MISGLGQRQSQPKSIKIRNQNHITFADNQSNNQNPSFSFTENSISPKKNHLTSPNFKSLHEPDTKHMTFSPQNWLQSIRAQQLSIAFGELVKKLQKISYAVLQSEYGSSFTQNSSYFEWITQIKHQDSVDKLLYSYTSILFSIIQLEQQQRINSQPKFKLINLKKGQRIKLKLILNQEEENQINNFKSKGLQSYVKKLQEESERYKRQHIRVKQRNRILQNELLKLSLDFKSKRELYITQITRLTEILHSSFMEVGKMFIKVSNPNNIPYPQTFLNRFSNENTPNSPYQGQVMPYSRKNVKSLSPQRIFEQNNYMKEESKLTGFFKAQVQKNSNYQNQLKRQSFNLKKNNQPFSVVNRFNRQFDAESAIEEKRKSQIKSPSLIPSVSNYNQSKQTL